MWRKAVPGNKQGSVRPEVEDEQDHLLYKTYMSACDEATEAYLELQAQGVAKEMARMVLPVSTYTEWVWKNDLHNTLHFLRLRADSHAQEEAQAYARAMLRLMRERLPRLMSVVWPETTDA